MTDLDLDTLAGVSGGANPTLHAGTIHGVKYDAPYKLDFKPGWFGQEKHAPGEVFTRTISPKGHPTPWVPVDMDWVGSH